ncbi:hypothetical protein SAMN05216203_2178 [Marinobacter daqiaonensis]|uniref:Methyl-accepting chemotaxis protein n=1 Tax=Marinobacter daqiaonensis TaxID=650891 RepID=A0A1I6IEK1_9GAMM|nr:hypothetical protein [Marinobacter daqiaonensis]SFR65064.1 hypothetical protein SAMN05216203_2178 [Marinobacter daqiaonensis]
MNHFFTGLTIRVRLIAGFIVLLAITLMLAGIGMLAFKEVTQRTDKADDASRLVKYVLELRTKEKNYLLRGQSEEADAANRLIKYLLEARRDEKNFQFRREVSAAQQVIGELNGALQLADELARQCRAGGEQAGGHPGAPGVGRLS